MLLSILSTVLSLHLPHRHFGKSFLDNEAKMSFSNPVQVGKT